MDLRDYFWKLNKAKHYFFYVVFSLAEHSIANAFCFKIYIYKIMFLFFVFGVKIRKYKFIVINFVESELKFREREFQTEKRERDFREFFSFDYQ